MAGGEVVVENGAMFSTMQGATTNNYGVITVNEGGTLITRMGGGINNYGSIVVNGTFNISDPEEWGMMGRFEDKGGNITGNGQINIANCNLCVITDADTFKNFSGNVHYYAASITTQENLTAALAKSSKDVPYIFITAMTQGGEGEYTLTVTDPTTITDRVLIVMYDDAWPHHRRNIDFEDGGSLTLVNTAFVRWMGALDGTVELYLDGGTLANWTPYDDLTDVSSEADIVLPTPVKEGYTFKGWRLEQFGKDPELVQAGKFDLVEGGYTFTAQYKEN